MPTRSAAKAESETKGTDEETYVVVVDLVNITTGRKTNGRPATTRLIRGTRLVARPDDGRVKELLAQGALAREDSLVEDMKSLLKHGNAKRPAVQGRAEAAGHFRVTATGVQATLTGAVDPALNPSARVQDEILPVDGSVLTVAPSDGH